MKEYKKYIVTSEHEYLKEGLILTETESGKLYHTPDKGTIMDYYTAVAINDFLKHGWVKEYKESRLFITRHEFPEYNKISFVYDGDARPTFKVISKAVKKYLKDYNHEC